MIHLLSGISAHIATAQPLNLGEIRAGFGLNGARVDTSNSLSDFRYENDKIRVGPTLVLEGGTWEQVSLEIAVFYNRYQFVRKFETYAVDESSNRIHIPILAKVRPLQWVSFGLGFYASYLVGSVTSNEQFLTDDERTSANDTGEHGLEGSIAFEWPLTQNELYIRTEYRHSFSLTPRSTEARNYQNLLLCLLFKIDK